MSQYFHSAHNFSIENVWVDTASRHPGAPLHRLVEFVGHAAGASHDSRQRHPPPRCYPGTQGCVISSIQTWFCYRAAKKPLLWLTGPTGMGKTTIAQTYAEQTSAQNLLAASFFFSRSSAERSDSSKFIATLALQFASTIPGYSTFAEQAIHNHPLLFTKAPEVQLAHLILEPLKLLPLEDSRRWILIVDGLDECIGVVGSGTREQEQELILSLLLNLISESPIPFAILLCSREEAWLKETFAAAELSAVSEQYPLYRSQRLDDEIKRYLHIEFQRICSIPRNAETIQLVDGVWPPHSIQHALVETASGQFAFATTAIRFVDDPYSVPQKQLDRLIASIRRKEDDPTIFSALDSLYLDILASTPDTLPMLDVVGEVICVRAGMSNVDLWNILDRFFERSPGESRAALRALHSVINVDGFAKAEPKPKAEEQSPLFHASFQDFLTSRARAALLLDNPNDERYIYSFRAWRSHHLPEAKITEEVVSCLSKFNFTEWFILNMKKEVGVAPSVLPNGGAHWFLLLSEWVWGQGLFRSRQLEAIEDESLRKRARDCAAYFRACYDESMVWFLDNIPAGVDLGTFIEACFTKRLHHHLSVVAFHDGGDEKDAYEPFLTYNGYPFLELANGGIINQWSLNAAPNMISHSALKTKLSMEQSSKENAMLLFNLEDLLFGIQFHVFLPPLLAFFADPARSKHRFLITEGQISWVLRNMLQDPRGLPMIVNSDLKQLAAEKSWEFPYGQWFQVLCMFLELASPGNEMITSLLERHGETVSGLLKQLGFWHMQRRFARAMERHSVRGQMMLLVRCRELN